MKRFLFIVGALVLAVVGATVITHVTGSPRNDFTETSTDDHTVTIDAGDGWTLERGDRCTGWRIRVGHRTTQCWDGPFPDGSGMAMLLQGEGHHFVVMVRGARVVPRVRFFSSTTLGSEIAVHALPGSEWIAVVDLGAAEAYGAQYLTLDGTLVSTDSFVTGTR